MSKYLRLTNMNYDQAVQTKQSSTYQRLALLEDSIETGSLLLKDSVLDDIKDELERIKFKNGSADQINTLTWVIRHIKNLK